MSQDYRTKLSEFFDRNGESLVEQARKWAGDPAVGDEAVAKALIALIDRWKPPPQSEESLRNYFLQSILEALRGYQTVVFITYSSLDGEFVDKIERVFDERGIRFWRDRRDLRAGRLDKQLEEALSKASVVLLVLSENSVESDWVEWEVTQARELERELGRDILCPIALDGSWKICTWPGPLRLQISAYNILDFSNWWDDQVLDHQLHKLLEGLGRNYSLKKLSEVPASSVDFTTFDKEARVVNDEYTQEAVERSLGLPKGSLRDGSPEHGISSIREVVNKLIGEHLNKEP